MTICSSVHGTCVCGINVYGPHNGLEYARRKSVVLLTLAAGVVIPAIWFLSRLSQFVHR
jgi:hypothetical protein